MRQDFRNSNRRMRILRQRWLGITGFENNHTHFLNIIIRTSTVHKFEQRYQKISKLSADSSIIHSYKPTESNLPIDRHQTTAASNPLRISTTLPSDLLSPHTSSTTNHNNDDFEHTTFGSFCNAVGGNRF